MLDTKEIEDYIKGLRKSGDIELFLQAAILGELHEIKGALGNLYESTEAIGHLAETLDHLNQKYQG